jgi:hypothetical protein
MAYLVSVKINNKKQREPEQPPTNIQRQSIFHYSFFVLIIMFVFMLAKLRNAFK